MKFQGHVLGVERDLKSGFGVVDLTTTYSHRFNFHKSNLHDSYQQPMPGDRVEFECHFQIKPDGNSITGFILTSRIALICRAEPIPLANNT